MSKAQLHVTEDNFDSFENATNGIKNLTPYSSQFKLIGQIKDLLTYIKMQKKNMPGKNICLKEGSLFLTIFLYSAISLSNLEIQFIPNTSTTCISQTQILTTQPPKSQQNMDFSFLLELIEHPQGKELY